jgi:spore coat protein A, manganese oxidase
MLTRKMFLKMGAITSLAVTVPPSLVNFRKLRSTIAHQRRPFKPATPDTILDPLTIPKYEVPLVIPPEMPATSMIGNIHYYEIAVRQFQQDILPPSMSLPTLVWSYGSANDQTTFNYPAFTVEAVHGEPTRIKWINDLKDPITGEYLPHFLPAVDQTLHWANPPGGVAGRDGHGMDQAPYTGPVPIVTHVHGAHTSDDSDGFTEAWYLPDATNIPAEYATVGSFYDIFKTKFANEKGVVWEPGSATFQYPNDQRATTLWYHDHTLGMTRVNVYAGPAGFYLLRGGPGDQVVGILPGPAPAVGDPPGTRYYEIPIVVQDRTFNDDGSLFYPDNRAYFEGLEPAQLQIPFKPDQACDGTSDIAPIWNPEFFGNTIVVNGKTCPFLEVEPRRYRLRFLNGCNARFLIMKFANDLPIWQIGSDGGFLPEPVQLSQILLAPAERADVIVDFTSLSQGDTILLQNIGPDEPFGGGIPGQDFEVADPATTGQVMEFRIVNLTESDPSTPPDQLVLPAPAMLPAPMKTRLLSLIEMDSETVRVITDPDGNIVLDCENGEPFGPAEAVLGTLSAGGIPEPYGWDDPITENVFLGDTEVWELHNFTADAHPIHIHEVQFEIVNRETSDGTVRDPELWETGRKDTVIAYPDEITRVKAHFDIPGLFVWHCHIVEHEDNEMMRPYRIVYPKFLPIINKNP